VNTSITSRSNVCAHGAACYLPILVCLLNTKVNVTSPAPHYFMLKSTCQPLPFWSYFPLITAHIRMVYLQGRQGVGEYMIILAKSKTSAFG